MKHRFEIKVKDEQGLIKLCDKLGVKFNPHIKTIYIPSLKIDTYPKKGKPVFTFITPKDPELSIAEQRKPFWSNMPEHTYGEEPSFTTIYIDFDDTKYSLDDFSNLIEQNLTKNRNMYRYPYKDNMIRLNRIVGGPRQGECPVYVISKGRSDCCGTSKHLSDMEVYHYVVVEPTEYQLYKERVETEFATIIQLDMTYKENYDACDELGNTIPKGSGGARNFCWDHSIALGAKWHWLFDDNTIRGFFWLKNNARYKLKTGAFLRAIEDWVNRYENIGMAGLNYYFFRAPSSANSPYIQNTRIYSYLLIRNDLPFRWRGRYNEDTILSLDVLKAGWCTTLINTFLADKACTQTVKGGNTDDLYKPNGTLPKSEMLERLHPDVSKVLWKYNRWHHHVDYTGFTQELKYKPEFEFMHGSESNDDYGMEMIEVPEELEKDCRSYLEENFLKK
ncbi:hypothetical protein Kuja_0320 [Vibrio phage vB_VchM_Kuja]|uniref:TET-Associated Glycosyltransferase domain-containing protein n=1 Tax=Vibrio phage vB_VchM_Kuja TaxID=2686437 RepID=A0A6B9J913_9CAUD|nr:beta-glucosyl-HMC-alpha-glucosyltransferase [Vibrio phage vB_VchM_Kuja]QGZ16023.1 hypothetical protein Kuja_0320 [Vibrio phage vB_VchM_Kuja]